MFPSNPVDGQFYKNKNDVVYKYNSSSNVWKKIKIDDEIDFQKFDSEPILKKVDTFDSETASSGIYTLTTTNAEPKTDGSGGLLYENKSYFFYHYNGVDTYTLKASFIRNSASAEIGTTIICDVDNELKVSDTLFPVIDATNQLIVVQVDEIDKQIEISNSCDYGDEVLKIENDFYSKEIIGDRFIKTYKDGSGNLICEYNLNGSLIELFNVPFVENKSINYYIINDNTDYTAKIYYNDNEYTINAALEEYILSEITADVKARIIYNLNSIKKGLNEIKISIPNQPVGSIYIQYPNKVDPASLGLDGVWLNISNEFAGDFFRAEGGEALPFEGG